MRHLANLERFRRLPHYPSLCDGLIRSLTLSRLPRMSTLTLNILNQALNKPLNSTLDATQYQGEMYPCCCFQVWSCVCVCVVGGGGRVSVSVQRKAVGTFTAYQ
jgi:hypothetical protein